MIFLSDFDTGSDHFHKQPNVFLNCQQKFINFKVFVVQYEAFFDFAARDDHTCLPLILIVCINRIKIVWFYVLFWQDEFIVEVGPETLARNKEVVALFEP